MKSSKIKFLLELQQFEQVIKMQIEMRDPYLQSPLKFPEISLILARFYLLIIPAACSDIPIAARCSFFKSLDKMCLKISLV